jgi:hypothetical protein
MLSGSIKRISGIPRTRAQSPKRLRELCGEDLPMNATRGDGTEFAADEFAAVREAFAQEAAMFDSQAGDVPIIDNMLAAHGRTPFTGEREVLVAMGRPVALRDVKSSGRSSAAR